MRGDGEVADARPVGQDHRHGRLVAALASARLQDVADGAGPERVAFERERDGGGEFLWPIVIEQGVQPDHVQPQGVAARGQPGEERRRARDGEAKAIAGARRVRLVGRREETVEMGGVLDRRAGVVAARMPRDLGRADDEPDGEGVSQEREGLADVGVRNRVAVAIEPDVRECAGHDRPHQVGLEGVRG